MKSHLLIDNSDINKFQSKITKMDYCLTLKLNFKDIDECFIEKYRDLLGGLICQNYNWYERRIIFYEACDDGNYYLVKFLIENNIILKELYDSSPFEQRCINICCEKGYVKILELLINNGATDYSNIALCNAIEKNRIQIVKILIKHDLINKNESFPLQYAEDLGHDKIKKILIKNGFCK